MMLLISYKGQVFDEHMIGKKHKTPQSLIIWSYGSDKYYAKYYEK